MPIVAAVAAGGSRDGTYWVGVHGRLVEHPWRRGADVETDAYSLFYDRSEAMDWLSDAAAGGRRRLWGMNDAEHNPSDDPAGALVAWFQASAEVPEPLLPIEALVACIESVLGRIGHLELDGLEIAVPLHLFERAAHRDDPFAVLAASRDWFGDADPEARTRVEVAVEAAGDPTVETGADDVVEWLGTFLQDVYLNESLIVGAEAVPFPAPEAPDHAWDAWDGSARSGATFAGTLAEWSPSAAAWCVSVVAHSYARIGLRSPVLVRIRRRME